MISADTAFVFAGIACLLALSPGPDNLFVLFQSMFWGWRAGFMITLGLCTGLLWHTFIVTIGVAA
ncbi:amino acid efflux protein [Advenella kashmirensis WT001]|uniref:Amino acid efflux protein n=1 Tax=Advenella kashmirensis (strain DSM 17095 / LMG 22695 / WT001) TaxID=1036672 RepID=I3U7V2_ADVKW|nr:amino acid efflux protein [Advenella kashmirensis WT001]